MDFGLRGRTALVCGGSRGIAFAAAEMLAAEGVDLVICSRDIAAVERATHRLGSFGVSVTSVAADLSTTAGLATAIEATHARHPALDILITNTGGPPTSSAMGADWPAWERASELLLRSAVELTRAFVPGMQERRWGRVIGITSFAVKRPVPHLVLSNALRAAVTGYFRTLADEVAADGVTVNTVLPGYTATERLAALADVRAGQAGSTRDEEYRKMTADTPAGRLGTAEEVASAIVYLASRQAGFMTGQALCVDGGAIRALL